MRTKIIAAVTIATIAAAGIGWGIGHPARHPAVTTTAPAAPEAAPAAPAPAADSSAALAKLTNTTLTAAGSELSVGLPATITISGIGDQVIYANVTMDEISQLSAEDAGHLISSIPAAAGYTDVYEMPVTLTVLGVTNLDGTALRSGATGITAADMSQFSIGVHPGSDPLPSSDTVTSAGCAGLPQTVPTTPTGATLRWCLHAFSGGTTAGTPVGGQYQASSGLYASPVTWASKRFASSAEIP
jgi:hypothetical protein